MKNNERFNGLLQSYLTDTANPEEWESLMQMIKSGEHDDELRQKIDEVLTKKDDSLNLNPDRAHELLYKILSAEKHTAKLLPFKKPVQQLWRVAAAAVIILSLSVGGYFYFNKTSEKQIAKVEVKNDVAPGGNKAILTLADGSQIILDNAKNGNVTQQGNTKVIKLDDGQLAYNTTSENGVVLYNTISTPKGGQYQVILADGSKVLMNAESSLRFPTSFSGKERNVELKGEGYFEVAKNKSKPFHVKVNDLDVMVLGTHFNINAYANERAVKTTLLEGSVKVAAANVSTVLKAGQQAILANGQLTKNNAEDLDEIIAWKEGVFYFNNADIQQIMKQVERWYDIEVEYAGAITKDKFSGKISRSANLSKVLSILSYSNVHFKLEGKKLTVLP